ncbi:MAG: hypothetical protein K9N62_17335, partial [Verrucomicrobia bacterium]|nr:hypothetical protein [Verrucomicrobiota bacterium]
VAGPITATGTKTTHCVDLTSPYRFFQVATVGGGTEPPPPPPPVGGIVDSKLTVLATQACVEWVSVAGTNYVVQGRVNIEDTTWDTVAGPITATGTKTTHCVDLTSPYRFFQVATVGGGTEPPVAGGDILLPVPRVTAGGRLQFTWTANSGKAYALQWSDGGVSSQPLVWTTITNVTGVTGSITVEDPTPVTNAVRFYRVLIP